MAGIFKNVGNAFVDVLWTLIDAFVPSRSRKVRQRKCYPKDIRKLICKKRQ